MVMADMRAHTNARTRTHTVFRHTLTGFVAALILCPPVTERFIPNDRRRVTRRSLPTSSCNPFVSLTQSTDMDGVALGPDPVCNSTFGGGLTVPIFLSGPYASYAQLETAAVTWNVGESGKRCVHGQLHFWVLHPRLYCHRFALWLFCVRRRA